MLFFNYHNFEFYKKMLKKDLLFSLLEIKKGYVYVPYVYNAVVVYAGVRFPFWRVWLGLE